MWRRLDERHYLRANPDVAAAVRSGLIDSARGHYERHGQTEGRRARLRPLLPRLSSACVLVRPAQDWFSGIRLMLFEPPAPDAVLEVELRQLTPSWAAERRTVTIRGDQIEPDEPFSLYWRPFQTSRQRRFLLTVRQRGGRWPLAVELADPDGALVYSSPESPWRMPPHLLLSPVTQCNLNCIHCISRHSRQRFAAMTDGMWAQVEAAAASGALEYVHSDYSGDILFDQVKHGGWLDRIIALDVPFGIDTHGNNLTEEIARKLLTSRLRSINFSLDSLDPEDYPRIRRGARPLAEVLDAIRMFMALRNAMRPELRVTLSYALMRRNLESVAAAFDFAAETGIVFHATHLHAWTADVMEESLLLDRARYAETYERLGRLAVEKGVLPGLPRPVEALAARRAHSPCGAPWQSLTVLGNGDVMACCVPDTKVGSLQDETLQQIWTGKALRAFRTRVNSDDPPEPCVKCPMLRVANNYASHAPGLAGPALDEFERRCVEQNPEVRNRKLGVPASGL